MKINFLDYMTYLISTSVALCTNLVKKELETLFIKNDQVHSYCTRQASSFHLPLVRTSFRLIVGSIYSLTPQQIATKGFSTDLGSI